MLNITVEKIYIFDLDGTIRRCTIQDQPCPNAKDQWELLPNVKDRLALIDWNRNGLGVATNQGGVEAGFMDSNMAYQLACDAIVEATGRFPPTGSIQVCTHLTGCDCRKPLPTMIYRIQAVYGIKTAMMIGDREEDRLTAEAAGISFMWAKDFFDDIKQSRGYSTLIKSVYGDSGDTISVKSYMLFKRIIKYAYMCSEELNHPVSQIINAWEDDRSCSYQEYYKPVNEKGLI